MNIRRMFTSFALLNPFAIKVAAQGNALVAYRNVLGLRFAVTGQAEQRAIVDYVVRLNKSAGGIDKSCISQPLGFINPRHEDLLRILLAPTPKAVATTPEHTILTKPQSAKLEGKRPVAQPWNYLSAVDKRVLGLAVDRLRPAPKALQVTNPSAPMHTFDCKLDELD